MTSLNPSSPSWSFVNDSAPTKAVNAAKLDEEIGALHARCNQLLAAVLNPNFRSDNTIADGNVRIRMLHPEVIEALIGRSGWRPLPAVQVASTGTVNLASANAGGLDGTALVGQRVLVKDQADPRGNGVYVVQADGSLARSGESMSLALVAVDGGSTLAGTAWVQTKNEYHEGITEQVWAKVATGTGGGSGGSSDGWMDVKAAGAIGDGEHHYLDAAGAAEMNARFGHVGLAAVAGDEHDWAVIQGVLMEASYTGAPVRIPMGTYLTNRPLVVQWTNTPATNASPRPLIRRIEGAGITSVIRGTIQVSQEEIEAGKTHGVLELLGESNPVHASCDLQHLVIEMQGGSSRACALRAGDAWCGITANRCWFRGANGVILKVAWTVSYAQLCTRFTNCVLFGNWAPGWMEGPSDWWATQSVAEASALNFESGGSSFDNVLFESCVFMGHVGVRANLATFLSCQFATNPFRPEQYKDSLHVYGGSLSLRDSYFEDHDVAVMCGAFQTPIRGVVIDGCHFSGVNNYVGSLPKAAIICYPMNWMLGPVTVKNCKIRDDFYTENPVQVDGTDVDIGPMCRAWSEETPSTGILPIAVTATNCTGIIRQQVMDDNGYSQGTEEHITKSVKFRDIEGDLATLKDAKIIRKAATESWGFQIENSAGDDVMQVSWVGPTCSYALPWMEADAPSVYIPGGKAIRFGFGVSPWGYSEMGPNGIYTVGSYRCNSGNDFYALGNVPSLFSVTLDYTAFTGINALTGHVEAWVQIPYAKVLSVMMEVLTPFAGTTTLTASCGTAADLTQYISSLNVKTSAAFTESAPNKTQSVLANESIRVRLTATGANLSALTAGSLRVNVLAVYGINS